MPGQDETQVESQEPTNEENETEEQENNEEAERYEDRVADAIMGVVGSEEENG